MSDRAKWVPFYVIVLLVAAGALAVSGYDAAVQPAIHPSPATREPIPNLAGTWEGTWNDTVFFAEYGMSWEITQDPSDLSATGIIDLTYFSLHGLGMESGSASGAITSRPPGETLDFTFTAATVGSGSGTIVGTLASGTGTVTPPLDFGDFTFQGTVSDTLIRGTFDYINPGTGAGKVLMTKNTPVEPLSWGKLKARYRDDG